MELLLGILFPIIQFLHNSDQHRQKVEYYIQLAKSEGGKIELGGDRPVFSGSLAHLNNGFFLNPTIISGLSASCRTQQEEIFGPVVGVTKFKTEEEGLIYYLDDK